MSEVGTDWEEMGSTLLRIAEHMPDEPTPEAIARVELVINDGRDIYAETMTALGLEPIDLGFDPTETEA